MRLRYSAGMTVVMFVIYALVALFLLSKIDRYFNPYNFNLQIYQQVYK